MLNPPVGLAGRKVACWRMGSDYGGYTGEGGSIEAGLWFLTFEQLHRGVCLVTMGSCSSDSSATLQKCPLTQGWTTRSTRRNNNYIEC